MENILNQFTFRLLLLLIGVIAALLGVQAREIYKKHVNSEEKEAAANSAVLFVEQVYKDLHGAEKLQEALEAARMLLEKRGIRFDEEEMTILLEAAVGNFNDAFAGRLEIAEGLLQVDVLEDYGEGNTDEE